MKLITSNLKLKLKGKHTTIIGGRYGYKVINNICKHDKIKSIIPSIIICKNKIRNNKDHAKVSRPDEHGNLILLLLIGNSIQEIRLITNVKDFSEGLILQNELNEILKII